MSGHWTRIASDLLSAEINCLGAELSSLRDERGLELMTSADPAFWSFRAPLLFPIVGRLNGDSYLLDGAEYHLPPHGFARSKPFVLREHAGHSAVFRLVDSEETRVGYPFSFQLDAAYTIEGATLSIDVTLVNSGKRTMPASFGFHPAFAWPLPYGGEKEAYRIRLDRPEPSPLRRLSAGLIQGEWPSPVEGDTLWLRDELFAQDALVWAAVESRALRYGRSFGPQLRIDFPDMPTLGIWTKPGAQFICIEPWQGIADPAEFRGEIWDKPGILSLEPGFSRGFTMRVTLET